MCKEYFKLSGLNAQLGKSTPRFTQTWIQSRSTIRPNQANLLCSAHPIPRFLLIAIINHVPPGFISRIVMPGLT